MGSFFTGVLFFQHDVKIIRIKQRVYYICMKRTGVCFEQPGSFTTALKLGLEKVLLFIRASILKKLVPELLFTGGMPNSADKMQS